MKNKNSAEVYGCISDVSGVLINPETKEVAKAPVRVFVASETPLKTLRRKFETFFGTVKEKPEGSFSLYLPCGKFYLHLSTVKAPYLYAEVPLDISADKNLSDLQVKAQLGCECEINVLDKETGKPIENALLELNPENSFNGCFSGVTDANGKAGFKGVLPCKCSITVIAEGFKNLKRWPLKLSANLHKTYKLRKLKN